MAEVRYIVDNVDAAIAFYTGQLGFVLAQQFGPAMAIVKHGDLSLWLAGPMASASKPMPDGTKPTPGGGWARIVLTVNDLAGCVARLKAAGVRCRNDIVSGPGGQQILVVDPAGNLIELFEPLR
jgi:catechol 2,3-dioxygenase-like lactoylglutathione lyase family enzyme